MRLCSAILISAVALLALACGNPVAKVRDAAERSKQQNDLKQLGLAIHQFNDENKRTPKGIEELEQPKYMLPADIIAQIKSGQINVIWSVDLLKSFDKVIAYRSSNNGMYIVLKGDGSVYAETQASFANMTKAVPAAASDKDPPEGKR